MSTETNPTTLKELLDAIEDPRINRTKRHKLVDVLFITVCAVLCGAEDFVHIAEFGRVKKDWFAKWLELPNGIPSHDTFARIFTRMDPDKLNDIYLEWIATIRKNISDAADDSDQSNQQEECIAIDGKTLRRSHDKTNGKSAIHMVSAWASEAKLVLGQVKVNEKSNEITAIPELLDKLDVAGCLVTIDAMGCQKEIASKIHEKKATYVLALKKNHLNMYESAQMYLEYAEEMKFRGYTKRTTSSSGKNHGRIETRKYLLLNLPEEIGWEEEKRDWPGLVSIGMVQATRQIGNETTTATRFYITGLDAGVKGSALKFARAVRNHWGIENKVHWCLDVAMNEDDCRVRKDNAPENLGVIRHIILNILRQDTTVKTGIAGRRLRAGWDTGYMEHLMKI